MCGNELMEIVKNKDFYYNENQSLVSENIYEYDITRCFANILKHNNIADLMELDKLQANITIGKMVKNDPKLYDFLRDTTRAIMGNFVYDFNIQLNDVVALERDGLTLTKYITKSHKIFNHYTIELKNKWDMMIKNPTEDRQFLLIGEDRVRAKGVHNKPVGFEDFLYKHLYPIINTINKNIIYDKISLMEKEFFNCNNARLFAIPIKNSNKYKIILMDKELELNGDYLDSTNINNLNVFRKKYFFELLMPYLGSLGAYYFNKI